MGKIIERQNMALNFALIKVECPLQLKTFLINETGTRQAMIRLRLRTTLWALLTLRLEDVFTNGTLRVTATFGSLQRRAAVILALVLARRRAN